MFNETSDPKILLNQRWDALKIGKKNKEYIGVKNAYMLMDNDINKNIGAYYDEMYKKSKDKAYALLKCVLLNKNVRLLSYKVNNLVMYLEKNYVDICNSPKVNINLASLKNRNELLELINTNFFISRNCFLEKMISRNIDNYEFVFKNNDTSYYANDKDNAYFVLSDTYKIDDSLFSYEAIKTILESSNDVAFLEKCVIDKVKAMFINLGKLNITLKNPSVYVESAVGRAVYEHNEKTHKKNNKLVLKGGIKNGKSNNG